MINQAATLARLFAAITNRAINKTWIETLEPDGGAPWKELTEALEEAQAQLTAMDSTNTCPSTKLEVYRKALEDVQSILGRCGGLHSHDHDKNECAELTSFWAMPSLLEGREMADRNLADELCSVERDRMTAAEICLDELLTIMDRHQPRALALYVSLRKISIQLDGMLLAADGPVVRRERLIRVRAALTNAFPTTDEDLEPRP